MIFHIHYQQFHITIANVEEKKLSLVWTGPNYVSSLDRSSLSNMMSLKSMFFFSFYDAQLVIGKKYIGVLALHSIANTDDSTSRYALLYNKETTPTCLFM